MLSIVQSKLSRDMHAQEKVGLAFGSNPMQINSVTVSPLTSVKHICATKLFSHLNEAILYIHSEKINDGRASFCRGFCQLLE